MAIRVANILFVIVIIGLQFRLWQGYANFEQIDDLKSKILSQKEKLNQLSVRNKLLIYEVLDLRHGSDALEEYAREEVGMIKKGEVFYQVLTPNE